MSLEIIALAILLFLAVGTAIFFFRKVNSLELILQDARSRLEAGKSGYDLLLKEQQEAQKNLKDSQDKIKLMENTVEESRNRFSKEALEHEKELEKVKNEHRSLSRRGAHLEEENAALKEQLREIDADFKKQKDELTVSLNETFKKREEQTRSSLESKIKSSHGKEIELLEKKVRNLTAILKKVDPDDYHKSKRKAKQMEQLYQSLKGLKELADERNKNWETALVKLSNHILGKPVDSETNSIGDVVGSALEKIGSTLVIDSEADEIAQAGAMEPPALSNTSNSTQNESSTEL